ncbi:hypothetical protein [Liberiplasma polymorphum]|uniref:hypothetical protein n=1 Tax=Liberiplasma polymorphum TaxID=3374570 RepID=UPI003773C57F
MKKITLLAIILSFGLLLTGFLNKYTNVDLLFDEEDDWPEFVSLLFDEEDDWPEFVSLLFDEEDDWPEFVSLLFDEEDDWPEFVSLNRGTQYPQPKPQVVSNSKVFI